MYDFNFRNFFDCKSVVSKVEVPVLLHIGAIEYYGAVEAALNEMGMELLVKESGYGPIDEAYTDKVIIDRESIRYQYKPMTESNSVRKWSYRTNR